MKLMLVAIMLCSLQIHPLAFPQRDFSGSGITKLVLLGTGNPNPSPEQSGCALAILVNDVPYVVDFGPGLILTPWVMGRDEPREVYGPTGTGKMTEHILFWGTSEEELLDEINIHYDGKVIVGRDQDIY